MVERGDRRNRWANDTIGNTPKFVGSAEFIPLQLEYDRQASNIKP